MATNESTRMYQLRVDLEFPASLVDTEEHSVSTLVPVLEAVQSLLAQQGFSLDLFDQQAGAPQVHGITLAPIETYG